jgi:hypothetical protein
MAKKQIRQAMRTLQTLRGDGKVFAGGKFLSDVRYTLTVQQGIVQAGSQPTAGVTDIKGTLVVVEGERNWKMGAKLSLEMAEGRKADFVPRSGSAADGLYSIEVSKLSDRP